MSKRAGGALVLVLAGTVAVASFVLWQRDRTGAVQSPERAAVIEAPVLRKASEAPANISPTSAADRVRAALAREVSFPRTDDPKITWREVLDNMAKQLGVRFDVCGEDADDLLKREIISRYPMPPVRMQADWVLSFVTDDAFMFGGGVTDSTESGSFPGSRIAYHVSDDRILVAPYPWFAERGFAPTDRHWTRRGWSPKPGRYVKSYARVVDWPRDRRSEDDTGRSPRSDSPSLRGELVPP